MMRFVESAKIYRVLGKRGRITIPFAIRSEVGISSNDILSFASNGNQVVITKEKICNDCKSQAQKITDGLTFREKKELLCCLLDEQKNCIRR